LHKSPHFGGNIGFIQALLLGHLCQPRSPLIRNPIFMRPLMYGGCGATLAANGLKRRSNFACGAKLGKELFNHVPTIFGFSEEVKRLFSSPIPNGRKSYTSALSQHVH